LSGLKKILPPWLVVAVVGVLHQQHWMASINKCRVRAAVPPLLVFFTNNIGWRASINAGYDPMNGYVLLTKDKTPGWMSCW